MKLPNVIKYLLIANIAMWMLSEILKVQDIDLNKSLALFYVEHPLFRPHQIITYMFMHANFMHIFFNMFALFMFGRIMAMTWNEKKFLLFYFVCGIGAAVTQEVGQAFGVLDPSSCTLGASGAVFGLLLAFGMTYPNERIFIIPIPFPIKAKYLIIGYVAIEVLQFLGAGGDGVAHLAHLGGMLFGYLLILYWKRNPDKDINNWRRTSLNSGGKQARGNIFGFGQRKPSSGEKPFTVTYGGANNRESDHAYNERKKKEAQEIDLILDKIRKSGWDSLSPEEQQKIIEASKK